MLSRPQKRQSQCKCNCILCYVSIICRKCPQNCSSQSVDVILNQHAQEVQGLSWLTVLHGSFKLLVGWMTIDGFVLGLSDLQGRYKCICIYNCVYMWVFIMHTDIYYIAHVVDMDMFSCFVNFINLESFKPSNATYSELYIIIICSPLYLYMPT